MDDACHQIGLHDAISAFPCGDVGRALAAEARVLWDGCRDEADREKVERICQRAGAYAREAYRKGAWTRSGDLDEWFSLPFMGLAEIARRQEARMSAWLSIPLDEEEDARRETEDERVEALERDGFYGRTRRFEPESSDWIFVRFGGMPVEGRSVFGLAGEDTEDGPDPWRQELGGMTHEAGVSVFRARRHPDQRGSLVLVEPDFSLARYGVVSQRSHLLSVMPDVDHVNELRPISVEGPLVTCKAADGTLRAELGSDGEYLVDGGRATCAPLDLHQLWVSRSQSVRDLLAESRRFEDDGCRPSI